MITEGIELLHQASHAIEAVAELVREVTRNCTFRADLDVEALSASLADIIKFKSSLLVHIEENKREQGNINGT